MTSKKATKAASFEDALAELEQLVETMEKGEMSLEESLKSFEKGIALTKSCQEALKAAEQKVEILSQADTNAELEPFGNE